MENGGVIMMEIVVEAEEAADEVIEEVVFDPNDITFLLLKYFQVKDRVRILQILHDCLTAQYYLFQNSRTLSISHLLSLFLLNDLVLRKHCTASLPCFFSVFLDD